MVQQQLHQADAGADEDGVWRLRRFAKADRASSTRAWLPTQRRHQAKQGEQPIRSGSGQLPRHEERDGGGGDARQEGQKGARRSVHCCCGLDHPGRATRHATAACRRDGDPCCWVVAPAPWALALRAVPQLHLGADSAPCRRLHSGQTAPASLFLRLGFTCATLVRECFVRRRGGSATSSTLVGPGGYGRAGCAPVPAGDRRRPCV
jgi:hypothetical protein